MPRPSVFALLLLSRSWNQPVEPFRIVGNLYYVGASDVTSFLLTTPQGHMLIDGGFEETAAQIQKNVEKLGFRVQDIRFLLFGDRFPFPPVNAE